jgi:hypothetical protein
MRVVSVIGPRSVDSACKCDYLNHYDTLGAKFRLKGVTY